MARFAYSLLLWLVAPLIWLRLLWRARRQREYLHNLGERYGFYRQSAGKLPIWVHAVSVGETRAAQPLIEALRARWPDRRFLLTGMTPTGRGAGRQVYGEDVVQAYLPYDYPGAVDRFLRHFSPAFGVLMETEIWPNLLAAAARRNVPVLLANARLSVRSARGYGRVGALARPAFAALRAVTAQTAEDAGRLRELGATNVTVCGNLKFDVALSPQQVALGNAWRREVGARPVWLAASTRDGEETLLLDAVQRADLHGALLIIVPRHPQRFDDVAALIAARGLRLQRRSAGGPIVPDTAVLLGDSMGEMFVYYAACDVVLMGGSFLAYGAHSLIEPCALGKPVIIGPSTYNFAEATDAAVAAGAAMRAADMAQAMVLALQLSADPVRCQRMGESGLLFTAAHRGATARVLELIQPQI